MRNLGENGYVNLMDLEVKVEVMGRGCGFLLSHHRLKGPSISNQRKRCIVPKANESQPLRGRGARGTHFHALARLGDPAGQNK